MRPRSLLLASIVTLAAPFAAGLLPNRHAAAAPVIVYDEAISGDLSNISGAEFDPGSPTQLGLLSSAPGGATQEYRLLGTTDSGTGDFFTIEIGAGDRLTAISLNDMQYVAPTTDDAFFLGLAVGSTFPHDYFEINSLVVGAGTFPNGYDISDWIGGSTIGLSDIGDDILPLLYRPIDGTAQIIPAAPLEAGAYTFLLQQTGTANTFDLGFRVTAVPEPSSLIGLAVGTAAVALRRRRAERRPARASRSPSC